MKKWISALIWLGYLTPALGTVHDSFLVAGDDLKEVSLYTHMLETPNFFSRTYPQNLNPYLVLIPRTNSGFTFGVTGSSQQIFDNQLDFAIIDPVPTLYSPGLASTIKSIKPYYQLGYGGYLGYVFPYTGKDILFDFYIVNANRHDEFIQPPGGGVLWTPLGLYDRITQASRAAAHFSTDFGQAKLLVGEHIFAGTRLHLRASMGVKAANINRELSTTYKNASSLLEPSFGQASIQESSHFGGVGPAVQVDAEYYFVPHFGLAAHITNAVIVGEIKSSTSVTQNLITPPVDVTTLTNTIITAINLHNTGRAVPNIDGKIAFLFTHRFCDNLAKLDIEIGYDFNQFFNAVDTYRSAGGAVLANAADPALPPTPMTNNIYVDTPFHIKNVSNLTLNGPYFSIGLSGIACPSNTVLDPVCLTIPRLPGGFVFGIGALYYRLQGNHRDYALLDPTPIPIENAMLFPNEPLLVPSSNASLQNLESNNAYGGSINIGYIFRESPYDITAHFEGARTEEKKNNKKQNSLNPLIAAPGGVIWPILTTPFFNTIESRSFAQTAIAKLNFSYTEAHADIGQAINADSLVWLRVFEGLEFVWLQQTLDVTYGTLTTVPVFNSLPLLLPPSPPSSIVFPSETVNQKSQFRGFGPRFGVNIGLPMGMFALVSELAGGFLAGSIEASYRDHFSDGLIASADGLAPITVIQGAELGTRLNFETQFAPFLDLKLGLAYTFNFFRATKWSVEFGYKAAHYFNTSTTFRHVTNNSASYVKQVGDLTLDGPYLDLTISGFDACPPDCIPRQAFCAYAPELKGGFEFALEWLYLQPHVTNLDFAIEDPAPVATSIVENPPGTPVAGTPDFSFVSGIPQNVSSSSTVKLLKLVATSGYRFHLGYIFPLTSNDISANIASYKGSSSELASPLPGGVLWTITNGNFGAQALLNPTRFAVLASQAAAAAQYEWQTGNIELGRRVKFYNLMMRFFAGVTYVKVKEDIQITYLNGRTNSEPPVAVPFDIINQDNDYTGSGPRLGVAGDLLLGCGFSLVGLIGTDLLVGRFDSDLFEVSSMGDVAVLNPDRRPRFVPALDGKIGLAYSIALMKCSQASLELGYQVNHYFNVKDNLHFTDYSAAFIKQDQDISFDGFYMRLQYSF